MPQDLKRRQWHLDRLREARPVTDTSAPPTSRLGHLRRNYKRESLMQDEASRVQRVNR
jgi:hypothetical protein